MHLFMGELALGMWVGSAPIATLSQVTGSSIRHNAGTQTAGFLLIYG